MWSKSRKPLVTTKAVRSPVRSNKALVATCRLFGGFSSGKIIIIIRSDQANLAVTVNLFEDGILV